MSGAAFGLQCELIFDRIESGLDDTRGRVSQPFRDEYQRKTERDERKSNLNRKRDHSPLLLAGFHVIIGLYFLTREKKRKSIILISTRSADNHL